MKKLVIPLLLVLVIFIFFKLFYSTDNDKIEVDTHSVNKENLLPASQQNQSNMLQSNTVNPIENKNNVTQNPPSTTQRSAHKKITLVVTQVQRGKSNNSGYAFIAYNGGGEQVYPVGAKLAEGVILKSLLTDGVIIDNQGTLEKHKLKPSVLTKTPEKPTSTEPPSSISPPPLLKVEKLPPQDNVNSIPPMAIPKEQSQSYQKYLELEAKKAEVEKMKREAVPPMGDPPMPEGGENFPPPN